MPKKKIDALRLLKQDHEEVRGLFEEIEGLSGRATAKKQKLLEKVSEALAVHTRIEEEIFYPAIHQLRSREAKARVAEAIEEHALVKLLLKQISDGISDDETARAKVTVLKTLVLHHLKEEEREMFAEAKAGLSKDELEQMGGRLEARKEALESGELEAAGEAGEAEEEEEEEEATPRQRYAESEDRVSG